MVLNFTKTEEGYVSTFTAQADFNLHLECTTEEPVVLYQRGTSLGTYKATGVLNAGGKVVDVDIVGSVYPKYVKLVSRSEVTSGTVTP